MKEVKGIRHRGRRVYLRCPVFTTVQFSLRDEGSSEYICLCEGREILSPNFQTFKTPGINSTELADWFRKPFIFLLHSHYYIYRRNWFLGHFCPPKKFKNSSSGELCMSVTSHFHWPPSGLNKCQIVETVHKTLVSLIFVPNIDRSTERQ
jgi:hypothetical protein